MAVPQTVPTRGKSAPNSPAWWLRRLHLGITQRKDALARLQRYYDGEFSLKYADERLREVFGSVFHADRFGTNWMRLVVNAVEERLKVDGFRVDGKVDDDAWDIWQAASLDETSSQAHLEALINGVCYVTVWPSDDADHPDITIEHPVQAIVERDPKRPRERLAGLRLYVDSWGYLHAELFLPDAVHMFRSTSARDTTWDAERMSWVYDETVPTGNEIGIVKNPYGVVPMVPMENLPRLALMTASVARDVAKRSELWTVMPMQDAINAVLFNTVLVANSQGYRQRFVTGLTPQINPVTGKAIQPFDPGVDKLFVAEDKDTKFGDLPPSDVTGLIALTDQLVHAVAAISQVPPHYLSSHADRLSGESIKAAESGLVSKVRRRQITFGGTWQEVIRLAGLMAGNEKLGEPRAAEVLWHDPETRSEAQSADAALKMAQCGVPWHWIMEKFGFTPQTIVEMEKARAADVALNGVQPPPVTQPPEKVQPAPLDPAAAPSTPEATSAAA